jgi:hypothetical protein
VAVFKVEAEEPEKRSGRSQTILAMMQTLHKLVITLVAAELPFFFFFFLFLSP